MAHRRLAALRLHLEPTVVPFLRVHDGRTLHQRRERDRLRELLAYGGEGAHRIGEEPPHEAVAAVPELRLEKGEELGARVDGDPRVLREPVRIDGPGGDRPVY